VSLILTQKELNYYRFGYIKPTKCRSSLPTNHFKPEDRKKLQQILSPNPEDDGAWIHQDAWVPFGQI
jgi:hypothetical protein